jgi:hypothetical protein
MRWLLAAALFFVAAPALGQQWGTTCDDTPASVVQWVGYTSTLPYFACWNFETEGASDSDVIRVSSLWALFCLNPSDDAEGPVVGGATVWIRRCAGEVTANDFNCPRVHDAVLDGTQGGPDTQNACKRVPQGRYYIEAATAGAAAGENPYVSVEAEQGPDKTPAYPAP